VWYFLRREYKDNNDTWVVLLRDMLNLGVSEETPRLFEQFHLGWEALVRVARQMDGQAAVDTDALYGNKCDRVFGEPVSFVPEVLEVCKKDLKTEEFKNLARGVPALAQKPNEEGFDSALRQKQSGAAEGDVLFLFENTLSAEDATTRTTTKDVTDKVAAVWKRLQQGDFGDDFMSGKNVVFVFAAWRDGLDGDRSSLKAALANTEFPGTVYFLNQSTLKGLYGEPLSALAHCNNMPM
jgi:hypothetical protein